MGMQEVLGNFLGRRSVGSCGSVGSSFQQSHTTMFRCARIFVLVRVILSKGQSEPLKSK